MLKNIFPRDQIVGKFKKPLIFTEFNLSDLPALKKDVPFKIHSLGLNIWDRIVQHRLKKVDPMAIAEVVDNKDPNICEEISLHVGENVLKDLYYVKVEIDDPSIKYKTVAEFMAAHIYPNNLHLTDVEFNDPYKPLSKTARKYSFQNYEGLNLLGVLIDNMVRIGREMKCDYIVLSAAGADLVPKFERHGFNVEDTPSGRAAMKYKFGPPMERKL